MSRFLYSSQAIGLPNVKTCSLTWKYKKSKLVLAILHWILHKRQIHPAGVNIYVTEDSVDLPSINKHGLLLRYVQSFQEIVDFKDRNAEDPETVRT